MGLEWQRRALTKPGNRAKIRIGKGNDAIGIKERTPQKMCEIFWGFFLFKAQVSLGLSSTARFSCQAICKDNARSCLLRQNHKR